MGSKLFFNLFKCPNQTDTMKTLVWRAMTYGAEAWTLKAEEKKRIQAAEMFCCRRLQNVSWKDKRRNVDILKELKTERELFWCRSKKKHDLLWPYGKKYKLHIN